MLLLVSGVLFAVGDPVSIHACFKSLFPPAIEVRLVWPAISDLRKEMMEHMSSNVMVDLVEDAIVPVNSRKASSEVGPLLQRSRTMKYMPYNLEEPTRNTDIYQKKYEGFRC